MCVFRIISFSVISFNALFLFLSAFLGVHIYILLCVAAL